jgi:hypothetical protein
MQFESSALVDSCPSGGISSSRLDNCRGSQPTLTRFSWSGHMYCIRFHRYAPTTHQEATCTPLGRCGRRGLYTSISWVQSLIINSTLKEEERKGGKKGRLLGIITLSDVLRYVIGPVDIQESAEPPEEPHSGLATPASVTTITEA